MMKTFTYNVGTDAVMNVHVTTEAPSNPTAENYRFDLTYNGKEFSEDCEVQYYDPGHEQWMRLRGTLADVNILNLVRTDKELLEHPMVYYTLEVTQADDIINVTPTGE